MMNRRKGRGMALLLAGVMIMTARPVSGATVSENEIKPNVETVTQEEAAAPASDFSYEKVIPDNGSPYISIEGYEGDETDLNIPASIEGIPVTCIGDYAFFNCSRLTSVRIPEGVISIDYCAFYGCSSLTSVAIPDSLETIAGSAFSGCSSLKSITIPKGVTRIVEDYAFGFCSSLTSIKVAEENPVYDSRNDCNAIIETESDTLISACANTKIPEGVTSIADTAFAGCSSLTNIIIPESMTSIGDHAFYGCSGLTSIHIPRNVTNIDIWAFADCSSLTSIKVADGNMVYDSRNNCDAIIETKNRKLIAGCKNTNIPEEITVIGEAAFRGCSDLTSIYIPQNVIDIEDFAFDNCSNLVNINIPEGVTRIGEYAFSTCKGLKSIIIPGSVTSIGSRSFEFCNGLTSICIPEGVTSIEKSAFIQCNNLERIYIPKSVTSIGGDAFESCYSLEDVFYAGKAEQWQSIYKGTDLSDVAIRYEFSVPKQPEQPDDSLKKDAAAVTEQIKAIGRVTLDKKEIIDKARAAYDALTETAKKYVPNASVKLLKDAEATYAQLKAAAEKAAVEKAAAEKAAAEKAAAEKAAAEKAAAEKAAKEAAEKAEAEKREAIGAENTVGNAIYVVAKNQTVILKSYTKANATSVKIPKTIKINKKDFVVTEIAANAFKNNKKLKKVTLPNSIKVIGKGAFQNCSNLKTVTMGSNVRTIGDNAFRGCSRLTRITIPAKVTKIGKKAFYNCRKLKKVTIKSKVLRKVGSKAFTNTAKKLSVDVPKKKLAAYKKLLKKKIPAKAKVK